MVFVPFFFTVMWFKRVHLLLDAIAMHDGWRDGWKDSFSHDNRDPGFKNLQGRAERMVQRRGCCLRTEEIWDTKCTPRANSPPLTWLPIRNGRIHIISLPSWTFIKVNAFKAARQMDAIIRAERGVIQVEALKIVQLIM